MGDIVKELNSSQNKIEFLLKNYKSLRDSDTKLWISYLVLYHNLEKSMSQSSDPCQAFCDIILDKKVPSMASLVRIRQKIQEGGKYPRSKPASKKKLHADDIRLKISELLKRHKPLRDCDRKLWLAYLVTYHNLKTRLNFSSNPYETLCDILLEDIPAFDSIRRTRQWFQQQGLYVGEVAHVRAAAKKSVKKWAKGEA